jgi:hypothetical protein
LVVENVGLEINHTRQQAPNITVYLFIYYVYEIIRLSCKVCKNKIAREMTTGLDNDSTVVRDSQYTMLNVLISRNSHSYPSENSHKNHDRYDKSRNSKQDDYKK